MHRRVPNKFCYFIFINGFLSLRPGEKSRYWSERTEQGSDYHVPRDRRKRHRKLVKRQTVKGAREGVYRLFLSVFFFSFLNFFTD